MTVDRESLTKVHAARARVEELERALELARSNYHSAVRGLYQSGASLRELATGLGISHQRIHQIVGAPGQTATVPAATAGTLVSTCGFCGCDRDDHVPFVPGPGVGICGICLETAEQAVDGTQRSPLGVMFVRADPNAGECCAFCKKRARQVNRLVASDEAAVCDECMRRCRTILARASAGNAA